MYNIIKRYCENEFNNGLMIVDMPTGSGKTYSVIKYIFDAVQLPNNKRKYFFITTLKKNLPESELKSHFEREGRMTDYREKYLWVDSNYENIINGFQNITYSEIPYEIRKTNEYKSLDQYVQLVKNLRTGNNRGISGALSAAEDTLRKEAEPKFRRMIEGILAKKFSTVEQRLQAIKTDKEWQWVAKLYPTVFMRDKQIIFMSMDKFLSYNSTVVEPSIMLYNSDFIDNAVIFIDEFDATKETVLKNIITNGLKEKIDYVEVFNTIYSALHTHSFPAVLTIPSKSRQESKYKNQSLQSVIDRTTKIADDIHNTFNLQYSYRTESVTDDNVNNFLFQDHQYHSILNGNKSFITSSSNHKARINVVLTIPWWISSMNRVREAVDLDKVSTEACSKACKCLEQICDISFELFHYFEEDK